MKPNKPTQNQHLPYHCAFALIALSMTACGPSEAPESATPKSSFAEAHFLNERPANVMTVSEARAGVEPGNEVAISGLIGGTLEPFVDGYAAFVLADPKIMFCNEMPEEHCPTPWDACCEDPDKLRANRISVQFVDADNQILNEGLHGIGGLKELSEVVVTGIISQDSTRANINLLAQKLYLVGE